MAVINKIKVSGYDLREVQDPNAESTQNKVTTITETSTNTQYPSAQAVHNYGTQLVADKADKVANPTNGDFAALDAQGNLTDSGKKAVDFETAGAAEAVKTAFTSGTATAKKAEQDGKGNVIADTYAPINSPTFTGIPNVPTAATGTSSTQIASTKFVQNVIDAAGRVVNIKGHYDSLAALEAAVPNPQVGDAYSIGIDPPFDVYVFDGVTREWLNYGSLEGEPGKGLTILGYYATEEALEAAVTSPAAGDAYGVGTAEPYDIYIFDGTSGTWVNNGALQGAKGDKGDTGAAAGFGTPTASIDANIGTPSVTVTASGADTAKVFSFDFKNLKGETGAKGDKGDTGAAGADGKDGSDAEVTKTNIESALASDPLEIAAGGTGAATATAALDNLLPSGAETGKVLIKTDTGYGWGEAGGSGGMLPTIHVETGVNTTVTATMGETTLSAVTDSTGKCSIDVPARGTWTVSDGKKSQEIKIEYCTDYNCLFSYSILGISHSVLASSTLWSRTDGAVGLNATASIGTVAGSSDFDTLPIYREITRVTLPTGDVMVKIPKFWYQRYVDEENIEYIKITNKETEGFTLHPAFLRAGVTYDYIYVGAYKTTANHTSKSGLAPLVALTRAAFRTGARAKGTGWGIIDLATLSAIQMLILVEFANNNVQDVIGAGVSSVSAAVKTGTCDAVPNLTGRPAGTATAVDVVWRGIEGFWGDVWEWTDGLNWNNGVYYVSNDPSVYADDTATGYQALGYQGSTSWSASYITALGLDSNRSWVMLPSAAGSGSASTYYSDGLWSSTGWRVFFRGGDRGTGPLDGLFAAAVNLASSSAGSNDGSRLLYLAP